MWTFYNVFHAWWEIDTFCRRRYNPGVSPVFNWYSLGKRVDYRKLRHVWHKLIAILRPLASVFLWCSISCVKKYQILAEGKGQKTVKDSNWALWPLSVVGWCFCDSTFESQNNLKDLSSSVSNFQSCVLIANGFCKLEEILMNRIQIDVRTGGVCYLVFCSFLDLITTIVTCRAALARGRSIPMKTIRLKSRELRRCVLWSCLRLVSLGLWNYTSAKLGLDKN